MGQGVDKLDVLEAAKTAYGSLWLNRRRLAGWAVVPVALVAAIDLVFQPYIAGLDEMLTSGVGAEWRGGLVAAGQVQTVLEMAVWTGLELACYRLFLLGSQWGLPAAQRQSIYLSLLLFNLALLALNLVPNLALDYARVVGGMDNADTLALILFPIYLFIAVRLAFVFPAICLGWPWDLKQRWAETRDNFWRLFLALLLGYLPVVALVILFSAIGVDVSSYELSAGPSPVLQAVLRALITLVAMLTATAITVAAVCQLTGFRAAGMTGQGPGPREIASRFD